MADNNPAVDQPVAGGAATDPAEERSMADRAEIAQDNLEAAVEKMEAGDDGLLGGRAKPALVMIVVAVLALFFVYTNQDPFGLFEATVTQVAGQAPQAASIAAPELPANSGSAGQYLPEVDRLGASAKPTPDEELPCR